ncbi:hypothetical protein AB0C33_34575 [Nonomuraea sp. NPDC048881]|uniref:hypothetical protein n=1 Tax=Nonomuraea sp. NPDC048881 TaxID=3155030 RepID=UPI0033D2582B
MSEVHGGGPPPGAAEAAGPESVTCHEDLVRLLAEQFARADVSLRELQARADRSGGARLPRSTCADMLAGRRFPKKAVMVAFLRGCRVPEHQLPAWERAWDRVRISRLPAGSWDDRGSPASDGPHTFGSPQASSSPQTAGSSQASGGMLSAAVGSAGPVLPGGAVSDVGGGGLRRAVLFAGIAVPVAAALVLAVVVALRLSGRPEPRPEGASGQTVDPGQIVTDDGRAFPRGGSSRFTVSVSPANTGVRLIRRLDAGVGLQDATIAVDGVPAARWRPLLEDAVHKWRNQIVDLPPRLTAGRRALTVVNTCVSETGFNEFLYTVEHRINGVWSVADRVDVGPDHPASEAAHDYRVVRGDWAHHQTFAYPPRKEDWDVR